MQQSEPPVCLHISSLSFFYFSPISVNTEHWAELSLYSRFSLVSHFMKVSVCSLRTSNVHVLVPVSQFIQPPFPLQCPFVCSFYLCFASRIIYTIFSYFEHCVFVKFLFCLISIAWCPKPTIWGAAWESWKFAHLSVLGTVGELGRPSCPCAPHPTQHLLHSKFLSLKPWFNSIFVPRGP